MLNKCSNDEGGETPLSFLGLPGKAEDWGTLGLCSHLFLVTEATKARWKVQLPSYLGSSCPRRAVPAQADGQESPELIKYGR